MTTGYLNKFLPGLSATYGPDQYCDIHGKVVSLSNFVSSEANQNVSLIGDLDVAIWVHAADGSYVNAAELLLKSVAYKG